MELITDDQRVGSIWNFDTKHVKHQKEPQKASTLTKNAPLGQC